MHSPARVGALATAGALAVLAAVPAASGALSAPTAALTVRPASAYPCQTVILDASASSDSGGTLTSVEWDTGSGVYGAPVQLPAGQPASGAIDSVSFPSAGRYALRVGVTDNFGLQSVAAMTYTVNPAPPSPPVPLFSASTAVAYVGDLVTFDGSASYQSTPSQGCGAVTHLLGAYAWDFGDGSGQAQATALTSHQFSSPGLYNVILRVTDIGGAAGLATATHALVILPRPPPAPPVQMAPPPPPTPNNATVQLSSDVVPVDASGYVSVRVRCVRAPTVCAGELQLSAAAPTTRRAARVSAARRASKAPKTIVLATAPFSVAVGKSVIVRLRLSNTGRAIVRSAGTKGLASTLTALPRGAHAVLTKAARTIRLVSAAKPRSPSRHRR